MLTPNNFSPASLQQIAHRYAINPDHHPTPEALLLAVEQRAPLPPPDELADYGWADRIAENTYLNFLERAALAGLQVTQQDRTPDQIIAYLRQPFEEGAQFIVPVHMNSKQLAWRAGRESPIYLNTAAKLLQQKKPTQRGFRRRYDLAIRTGKWKMPDRNPDQILAVLDIDNWRETPYKIKATLANNPTYVVQTSRGFHFYFWVPHWFAKSGSNPGIADWQAQGRIVVFSGADRLPVVTAPIAELPKPDVETLYNFATRPAAPPRYEVLPMGNSPVEDFVEGERNYRINATLFRLRNQLTDEQLLAKAQALAAECLPPYPPHEAESIARSIIRHRHRFPVAPTQAVLPMGNRSWHGDIRYARLGKYFAQKGVQFTRADYENHLANDQWQRDKRGKIEAARQDIEHNLTIGAIRVVGQTPVEKSGGRPAKLYERVENYQADDLLPVKPTAQNIRLSIFMKLLPDQNMQIVRATLRKLLGVGSNKTITRYSQLLQDAARWGKPLIEKIIQQPYIRGHQLNPRHPKTEQFPLPNGEYRRLRRELVTYRPSIYRRTEHYHAIMREGELPETTVKIVVDPNIKRGEGIKSLKQILEGLRGVAKRLQCLPEKSIEKEAASAHNHITCNNKTVITKTKPAPIPPQAYVKGAISPMVGNSPPLPLRRRETLEKRPSAKSMGSVAHGQPLLSERPPEVFDEMGRREKPEERPRVKSTGSVAHGQPLLSELPPEAFDALGAADVERDQRSVVYLNQCYEAYFGKPTRKPDDLAKLVKAYGVDWVETALLITHELAEEVAQPFPHMRGILQNWYQQGDMNRGDQQRLLAKHRQAYLAGFIFPREMNIVRQAKSVYHAYHYHIQPLRDYMASVITEAVKGYGETAVWHAIEEAVKTEVRHWAYCQAILERLASENHPMVNQRRYAAYQATSTL